MSNPMRLAPPSGAKQIKYEVRFSVSERGLREDKTVVVDVRDTGNEQTNKADAIVTASMVLDDQGIRHWDFKSCNKATS